MLARDMLVNGNLEYFEAAVQLIDTLTTARDAITVFMEIAPLDSTGSKAG